MGKVGEVVHRDVSKRTVRVKFPLYDDKISAELTVVNRNDNWMPVIGDQVLCIYIDRVNGYVVGVV